MCVGVGCRLHFGIVVVECHIALIASRDVPMVDMVLIDNARGDVDCGAATRARNKKHGLTGSVENWELIAKPWCRQHS